MKIIWQVEVGRFRYYWGNQGNEEQVSDFHSFPVLLNVSQFISIFIKFAIIHMLMFEETIYAVFFLEGQSGQRTQLHKQSNSCE